MLHRSFAFLSRFESKLSRWRFFHCSAFSSILKRSRRNKFQLIFFSRCKIIFLCSFVSTLEDVSSLSKFHFVFVLFFSFSFNRPNLFFPIQSRAQLSTVQLSFFFHFCFAGEIAKLRNCGQSKVCPEGRAQDRDEVDRNSHRVGADTDIDIDDKKNVVQR